MTDTNSIYNQLGVSDKVLRFGQEVLAGLPPEDRTLIFLRFFSGKTQSETAKVLGTTQVQISRRERKILKHMRGQLLTE